MASDEETRPWVRLLKMAIFGFIAIMFGWTAISSVPRMLDQLRDARCKTNLRKIAGAIGEYRNEHNQFPYYLTGLHPKYLPTKESFVCSNDRLDGTVGAQPDWMKAHDTGDEENDVYQVWKAADLDGSSGDPDYDRDTMSCSYLYSLNYYPEAAFEGGVWREVVYQTQKNTGIPLKKFPIVRCYHHLKAKPPPKYNDFGERQKQEFDDSYSRPTYNVLYDLTFTELPEKWR
ncbi:MAG: hypothetical protein QF437_03375 [Planctomycetota bacterium]|jgi:hypothetical protein|nr:hypothetical protein [Planctomycetota bacterium]MDP7129499.1 hypothetical protein [Planctomycetota bacterium]MDP7250463.1 hypothetical protein [Planctomycetota bacterium]